MPKIKIENIKILLSGLFLLNFYIANSQNFSFERGMPFIVNYSPTEYSAHEQNFDVIQDTEGYLYFANFSGIVTFDGAEWTTVTTSSGMRAVSLAVNNEGIVFVGGVDDFGYLITLPDKSKRYISLSESLKNNNIISEVFNVYAINNKVYFITKDKIYIYNENKKIEIIKLQGIASSAYNIENKLYIFFKPDSKNISKVQNGLTIFSNSKFIRISKESNLWIDDIVTMFDIPNSNKIIFGTSGQGFFTLENNEINAIEGNSDKYLRANGATCGTFFDGNYLFGTLTGGIVITNIKGKIIQVIDKQSNLRDDAVSKLFVDKNNDIWVATQNGISLLKLKWPFSYIKNDENVLNGKIQKFLYFKNKMFVATDKGLFVLNDSAFVRINEIKYSCWDISDDGTNIFAATTSGIYKINEKNIELIGEKDFSYSIYISKFFKNRIYVGHKDKVEILENVNGKYSNIGNISGFTGYISKMEEDKFGNLFIENPPGKIYLYNSNSKKIIDVVAKENFLYLHLNKIEESVFFTSEQGLKAYNQNNMKIVDFKLPSKYNINRNIWAFDFYSIPDKGIFYTDGEQKNMKYIENNSGKFELLSNIFKPVNDMSVSTFYFDNKNKNLWVGTKNGIIIFNSNFHISETKGITASVSKITNLDKDSIIYFTEKDNMKFNYGENSLRFNYSAPLFPAVGKVQYRYFLKGFDSDTSNWVSTTQKDYTNLPDRKYEFYVEAKNEFEQIIGSSVFKFEVLTPIYRRWWMFLIYVVIVVGFGKIILDKRMKIAEKEKDVLEEIVKERTEEIAKSKEEIEMQRDHLYRQRQEIIDSINYAKKIQEAVLPSTDYSEEIMNEHFIIFKPRDIVSGDFYWMKKINNFIIVVAADCTGHGVPGAFMSMLGNSYLNEIVTRRSLDSAGQILNRLRSKVKKSLHQKGAEGEQKDGMDIALVIIDEETMELQYSGAYNPLYLIRNINPENPEFIELKADRQPIGIHINEKEFSNHKIQLEKGDALYIFSDGYIDQFGGEAGGKYKTVRFKEMLLSIQDRSMVDQKFALEQTFTKWKRDLKQVDDVLVMGMKI